MGNSKVQDFSQEVEDYSEDLRVLVLTKMREGVAQFCIKFTGGGRWMCCVGRCIVTRGRATVTGGVVSVVM